MAGGGFDYRQLERLQKQIDAIGRGKDGLCRECARELASRLLRKVKLRTPVGQYPAGSGMSGGTLRRGWTIGEIRESGDNYEVEVINPAEYASYVEYGHRTAGHSGWVPGRFMMTVSEEEIRDAAPGVLEKRLRGYLRGCLGD